MAAKPQRIRDPVHNLIPFGADQFEQTLWQVIQTRPFQRLRRIRQLGFSELVFPGATHTRFSHSIGAFHVARQLMLVIRASIENGSTSSFRGHQAQVALAAALLHDVGHGMFSHAFEAAAKDMKLPMTRHERISEWLIRESEIGRTLNDELGSGFANDVATLIGRDEPGSLYDAVVSSQFDADRLDYMQRDRLMTGVQSSAVDTAWLLANLEVFPIRSGDDNEGSGTVETLVLGPKAVEVAESYVLSLFHLYPNVYLHKATRGAEMLFAALMRSLLRLVRDGQEGRVGLAPNHPMIRFAHKPDNPSGAMALDDTVFWGALPQLAEAEDETVCRLATALRERHLLACVDVRHMVDVGLPTVSGERPATREARIGLACSRIVSALRRQGTELPAGAEPILVDEGRREPYKLYGESKSLTSRILIRTGGEPAVRDMAEVSSVVAGARTYEVCRAYVLRDDTRARETVANVTRAETRRANHADA